MFCPHCGKDVNEGQAFCHHCGGKVVEQAGNAGTTRRRTAWEDREQGNPVNRLFMTLKESLFTPTEFFRTMNVTGGIGDPVLYAMITGVCGIMVFYVWQILFHDALQGFMPRDVQGLGGLDVFSGLGLAFLAVLMPFFIIMGAFLWSGLLHLLLLMVKGANNGFEATFRVTAYSYGAYLFMMVPFCGGAIAAVWGVILTIIGLKEAHGTSGGKASFAVLFPMILCCVMLLLFVLLVLGTAVASFGTMRPMPWK